MSDFSIRFWGVRGSIACPGQATSRYGGNTSCMEVTAGDRRIIIDGGSGIRELGQNLLGSLPSRVDIFFTHTHWDHVCGIPFFVPAYLPNCQVNFWAGHLKPEKGIKEVLADQMLAPLFPVPMDVFKSCAFNDYECGKELSDDDDLSIQTCWLNHPNRCCGYRIEFDGKAICVITDTEHRIGLIDETIVDFCRGADLMIYDAMYTDEEFQKHIGWGHSTWQEALRVGEAAGVDRVVMFHHEPSHSDAKMDEIAELAWRARPGSIVAWEGLVLTP